MRNPRALAVVVALAQPALARQPEAYPKFPTRLDTAAAVHTAAHLAHALRDPPTAERLDIPPDVLADAERACLAAAAGKLAPEVRAEAVQCAADLGADVTSFLADETPALRATAAALLGPRARPHLIVLAADKDPFVAATALGLLCADDAPRTLRDLDERGRARILALIADKAIDRGLAAHLALCVTQKDAHNMGRKPPATASPPRSP